MKNRGKNMMEELGIVGTIRAGMKEILESGESKQRRGRIFFMDIETKNLLQSV